MCLVLFGMIIAAEDPNLRGFLQNFIWHGTDKVQHRTMCLISLILFAPQLWSKIHCYNPAHAFKAGGFTAVCFSEVSPHSPPSVTVLQLLYSAVYAKQSSVHTTADAHCVCEVVLALGRQL